ncbi:MAG: hypothetical protein ABI645_03515 [Pseudomonadota bacterium]
MSAFFTPRTFARCLIAATALTLGVVAHAADCTRAGLAKVTDDYLAALTAHKPAKVSLAKTVKYTENAKVTKVGEGLWKTAGKVTFKRKLLDPERCGALIQALLEEEGMDKPTIMGIRLHLAGKKVTEIEAYIARSTEFAFKPEGVPLEDGEDWEALVPANERTSRDAMNAAADQYFNMFDTPAIAPQIPFATPCNRFENGTKTTHGDCTNMGPAGRGGMKMTKRRYPLSDLEAGMTAGFVLFGGRLLDFHIFKFRNGKITQIQAVIGPAVTENGWD